MCASSTQSNAKRKRLGRNMVRLPVSRDTGWERLEAIAHRLKQNSVKFLRSGYLRNRLEKSLPLSTDVHVWHATKLHGLEEEKGSVVNSGARFDLDSGRKMYRSLLDALRWCCLPKRSLVQRSAGTCRTEARRSRIQAPCSLALACTRSHRQGRVIRQSSLRSEDESSHGEVANECTISFDDHDPDFAQTGHDADTLRYEDL